MGLSPVVWCSVSVLWLEKPKDFNYTASIHFNNVLIGSKLGSWSKNHKPGQILHTAPLKSALTTQSTLEQRERWAASARFAMSKVVFRQTIVQETGTRRSPRVWVASRGVLRFPSVSEGRGTEIKTHQWWRGSTCSMPIALQCAGDPAVHARIGFTAHSWKPSPSDVSSKRIEACPVI